jgi:hypothetical protein
LFVGLPLDEPVQLATQEEMVLLGIRSKVKLVERILDTQKVCHDTIK